MKLNVTAAAIATAKHTEYAIMPSRQPDFCQRCGLSAKARSGQNNMAKYRG